MSKAEVERQLAARAKQHFEESQAQTHRFMQVLCEYEVYTRTFQLDLAEAAILWAVASLVGNDRRGECKANFVAFIDMMYCATEDAEKTYSKSKRDEMFDAAQTVQETPNPRCRRSSSRIHSATEPFR